MSLQKAGNYYQDITGGVSPIERVANFADQRQENRDISALRQVKTQGEVQRQQQVNAQQQQQQQVGQTIKAATQDGNWQSVFQAVGNNPELIKMAQNSFDLWTKMKSEKNKDFKSKLGALHSFIEGEDDKSVKGVLFDPKFLSKYRELSGNQNVTSDQLYQMYDNHQTHEQFSNEIGGLYAFSGDNPESLTKGKNGRAGSGRYLTPEEKATNQKMTQLYGVVHNQTPQERQDFFTQNPSRLNYVNQQLGTNYTAEDMTDPNVTDSVAKQLAQQIGALSGTDPLGGIKLETQAANQAARQEGLATRGSPEYKGEVKAAEYSAKRVSTLKEKSTTEIDSANNELNSWEQLQATLPNLISGSDFMGITEATQALEAKFDIDTEGLNASQVFDKVRNQLLIDKATGTSSSRLSSFFHALERSKVSRELTKPSIKKIILSGQLIANIKKGEALGKLQYVEEHDNTFNSFLYNKNKKDYSDAWQARQNLNNFIGQNKNPLNLSKEQITNIREQTNTDLKKETFRNTNPDLYFKYLKYIER